MYGSIASLDMTAGAIDDADSAAASPARWTFKGGVHRRDECGPGAEVGCATTGFGCVSAILRTETGAPVVSNFGGSAESNEGSWAVVSDDVKLRGGAVSSIAPRVRWTGGSARQPASAGAGGAKDAAGGERDSSAAELDRRPSQLIDGHLIAIAQPVLPLANANSLTRRRYRCRSVCSRSSRSFSDQCR
ncbi:hypothetical protein [Mycobacterium sp. HM-7]